MLYSTCTFSPVENEGTISFILEEYPEMELLETDSYKGFSKGNPAWGNGDPELTKCLRIFPHRMDGEGHFMALMRKKGSSGQTLSDFRTKPDKEAQKLLTEFFAGMDIPFPADRIEVRSSNVYCLPPADNHFKGIRFLRNGLFLGE